jgi:polyisoprenyl-phosphate glycosyltransferase
MNERPKLISIIVPFLNEEQNLPVLYNRIHTVFQDQPEDMELVLVDDGSTDGSVRWVEDIARKDPRIKLIELSRDFGHQIAITAGMDHARGDAAIIMDADLQDPPEVIPELLAKWREGYEVVYAVRHSRAGESWAKKWTATLFYKLFKAMVPVQVPVDAGDFRLVDRCVINALREVRELHRFVRGLTCWVGYKQCAVYYDRAARLSGKTKYRPWHLIRLAWDAMTSFSGAPLRWVTTGGVVLSVMGGIQTIRIIWAKLTRPEDILPGWATLAALILIVGGIQLVCLGVIGQYVSRIFEESKKRPLYFVRERNEKER